MRKILTFCFVLMAWVAVAQVPPFIRHDYTTGTLAQANAQAGKVLPFNPARTYVVFMGDSLTMSVSNYPYILTNYPAWTNFALWTNQGVAGVDWHSQTNTFFSNTLAHLPALATNGTNVIISTFFGANEVMNTSFPYTNIQCHSNFTVWAKTRGYKIATVTPLPRGSWADNAGAQSVWARFSDYILLSTNIDYVIDAGSILGDCFNPSYYGDTDPVNTPLNGLHPNKAGQELIAREWDAALRYGNRPRPVGLAPRRFGYKWIFFDGDYNVAQTVGTNGALATVRGGAGNNSADSHVGGVFSVDNNNYAAIVRASALHTTGPIFGVQLDNTSTRILTVYADGYIENGGTTPMFAGKFVLLQGAGSAPYIATWHFSGDEWRWRSQSDGSMDWFDSTSNAVRMVMSRAGNLGISTATPLSLLHASNTAAQVAFRVDTSRTNDIAQFYSGTNAVVTIETNALNMRTNAVLKVQAGANSRMGETALINGTVTVNNASVTANTKVMAWFHTTAGTTAGILNWTVSAGTSFTITSVSATGTTVSTDTSTVNYWLIEN